MCRIRCTNFNGPSTILRDQYGATPLHKVSCGSWKNTGNCFPQAVLFYQPKLVKLISEKFPLTTKVKVKQANQGLL